MKKQTRKRQAFTREERRALRQRQVHRQKILLAVSLTAALAGIATLVFLLNSREKPEILTINSSCEAYHADVETAAAKYGMSDYVDLILALMMQESSGQGTDVLQASEGAYNEKYPQEPGGIKDAQYSIECGIQELKYAMEKAGVQSPTDIENIKLALQAYNFGADVYFSYMEKQGNTRWSEESAEAFARIASNETLRKDDDPLRQPAGPWAYGDQKYPEHVLQYYHPQTDEDG